MNHGKTAEVSQDIPKNEHYAIFTFSSITIPGDERSRQCPGHGYPEHTENTVRYKIFTNKDEWVAEIKRKKNSPYSSDKEFIAAKIIPAQITTDVSVTVDE